MKLTRRNVGHAALGAAALAAGFRPALAQARPVSLWHAFSLDTEVMMRDGIAGWNAANPSRPISERVVPFAQLRAEIVRAVATGSVPDLVVIDNPIHASFANDGVVVDLTARVRASSVIKPDSFHPGPWSTVMWRNRIFGVPRDSNTIALFVNRDMMRARNVAVPKTWDELRAAAATLTDPANRVFGLAFSAIQTEEGTFQFLPFLQQNGGSVARIDAPEAVEALTLWTDLVRQGHAPRDVVSIRQSEAANQFIAGNAAMAISGPWDLPRVARDARFAWGIELLPVRGGTRTTRASALGGWNWAIPEGARNPDGAFAVIEFMSQPETASKSWLSGRLPPRADIAVPSPANPEAFAVFNEQLKSAAARGPHPQWPDISRFIQLALQEALTGTATPQAALAKAASGINPILARMSL